MPINPKLKEHLEKNVQMDDKYRAGLIAMLDDAPADVQNLWMAQADYTRQVNAFKAEQVDWKKKADDYYDTSNKNIAAWQGEVKKAQDAATAAQARVTELEALRASGGTIDDNALSKEITRLNSAITDLNNGIDAKLAEKLKGFVTPDGLQQKYTDAVGFMGQWVLELEEIGATHQEMTGKRMTRAEKEELIKFTNDESQRLGHMITPTQAYDAKYKDDHQKLHDAKVAADAVAQYKSQNHLPTGDLNAGPGSPELGPMQMRLKQEREAQNGKKDGYYSSWQEAAAAGGQELVNEGKF